MRNIYHDHLEQLRNIKISSHPAVSLYIPLKWNDFSPDKIFSALMKAAESTMLRSGNFKLEIKTPEWNRWLEQGTVTLAIFHHNGMTNLIPLPTKMKPRVVVANSFHVKPILTASNEYIDSLLLHFNEDGANLYRVNPAGETFLGCYLPSEVLPEADWPSRLDKYSLQEFLEFLHLEIRGSIQTTTKILGITGASFSDLQSDPLWKTLDLPLCYCDDSFRSAIPLNAFSSLRLRLSQLVHERHIQSVNRVSNYDRASQESSSVTTLPLKILNKEIKNLCVSLDCMHFGEVDYKTGNVILSKSHRNGKDDDLLDDLVEMAIDKGIEVSVVPKEYLPSGRSFIAS